METTRRSMFLPFVLVSAALLFGAYPAVAEVAGTVTRIQAEASATSAGQTRPLARDSVVNTNDVIRTGADARLEITLRDGTALTMGANGELVVDTFIYRPGASTRRILVDIAAGAFRFVSGKLGRLASDDMIVRTPVAAVGVRGTDFWGGIIDAVYGFFLYTGGIVVSNDAGTASLDSAGTGVGVPGADVAPGPVVVWSRAKVLRATATVAFERLIPNRPPARRPGPPPIERLNPPRPRPQPQENHRTPASPG